MENKEITQYVAAGTGSEINPDLLGPSNRYLSERGIISLVRPCIATMQTFEIYCIEGDLFEDIERYHTLEEAEEAILNYLK